MDIEKAGRDLIAKIRSELAEPLKSEGLENERGQSVAVEFAWEFGRRDYEVIKITVEPPHNITARKVTYRVKVREATPVSVKAQIEKAVAKAREFKAEGKRQAIAERQGEQRKRARLLAVREAMARHLPEFKDSGDGSLYMGTGDIDIHPLSYDEAKVKLRLDGSFTYEEARAIVDFINGLRTSAGSGETNES